MADSESAVLSEFELLVVLAVLSLGDRAYPLAIADAIQTRTGRRASRGAVLITLERLEDQGLVTSSYGESTPVRGGRPKRFFRPRPAAVTAARQALERFKTMTVGLHTVLKLQ